GLYSWWVDQGGADDLSRALRLTVECGLIYAGLAGATRWPSGKRSNNTLWLRVMTMHLGGNHEFSTFRRTLGAIVAHANDANYIDEDALTQWMYDHLQIVTIPYDDRDVLGRLERDVLGELDPPLNLLGMQPTPVRRRLKELRRAITN
ncbi:MAG: GIY-YIG nuclease family protein, partial [Mycobacteriaceae bacterium]